VRARSGEELAKRVRRAEDDATLGARVVIELHSERHAAKPSTRAWAITRRAQRAHRRQADRQPRRAPPGRPRQPHRPDQPSPPAGPAAGGDRRRPLARGQSRRPRRLVWWGRALSGCCLARKLRSPAGRPGSAVARRLGPYASPSADPYACRCGSLPAWTADHRGSCPSWSQSAANPRPTGPFGGVERPAEWCASATDASARPRSRCSVLRTAGRSSAFVLLAFAGVFVLIG
jgi:hypothetical protein